MLRRILYPLAAMAVVFLCCCSSVVAQPAPPTSPRTTVADTMLDLSCQNLVGSIAVTLNSTQYRFSTTVAVSAGTFTTSLYQGTYSVTIQSTTFNIIRTETWVVPNSGSTQTLANVGSPSANIACSGGGSGGSIFTGSLATNPSFASACPAGACTFSLMDVSVKSPRTVGPITLTASVSSETFTSIPSQGGAAWTIAFKQAPSGTMFSVTPGGAVTGGVVCDMPNAPGVTMWQDFLTLSDGSVVGGGCRTDEAGILRGPAGSAPTNAPLSNKFDLRVDGSLNILVARQNGVTSETVIPTTCGAGLVVSAIPSTGIPTCATAGANPPFSVTLCPAPCTTGAVGDASGWEWWPAANGTITSCSIAANVYPTGAALIAEVVKNPTYADGTGNGGWSGGTTVFTSTKLVLPDGGTSRVVQAGISAAGVLTAASDFLVAYITQIGTTTPGKGVAIKCLVQ